jgi:hypothetical protein
MTTLVDLGKLRFHFAGDWSDSTVYEPNDIVKYGGNVYVYTYLLKTSGNLPTNNIYWALMVEGFKFRGNYTSGLPYRVGDAVAHGGKVYVCILDVTNQVPPNATYWSQFADGVQYEGIYSGATSYQRNDMVTYGGSMYIAKQDTTNNLPTSSAHWTKMLEGISSEGVWNSATVYVPDDLVAYGGNIYRAKIDVPANNVPTNTTYWELFTAGMSFMGDYSGVVAYKPNEVVKYGGSLYKAKSLLSAGTLPTVTASWDKMVPGISNRGTWVTATQYNPEDVVQYGGNTFICLLAHASGTFATDLTASRWQKFNSGIRWRNAWITGTNYVVDDIVSNGLSTYICKIDHTSGTFATDLTAVRWELMVLGQAVLPVQTGHANKVLKTDGTTPYWSVDPVVAPSASNKSKLAISDGSVVTYDAFPINAMYIATH